MKCELEGKPRLPKMLVRALLASMSVLVLEGAAAATEITLRVDGLTCPFCAFGVEKKLLALPGVVGIDFRLDEGKIGLTLAEGAALDVPALREAVKKAGFTLHSLLVEDAVGHLSRNSAGDLVFTSADPSATFEVGLERVHDRDWSLERLPVAVRVSGTVTDLEHRRPVLVVSEIEPQGDSHSP